MSTHRVPTDKKCSLCGGPLEEVSMKSPYIDDFDYDCMNEECRGYLTGTKQLRASASRQAREEEARCDEEE